jgi:hypothetical protein
MDRQFKRPSDGVPSEGSKRQRVEGHASGGFASGLAGKYHLRFLDTALPSAQSQELHERRESTSFEVPASQQVGGECLLGLRNQLQEIHHWSQAVLAKNEQSMLQQQQEEVFNIEDYLNLASDSDHESDQRDRLEAHRPKGIAPSLSQRHEGHDQAGPSDQTEAASEQERPWTKQDLHQFFVELAQTKNFNPKAMLDSLSEECKVIWMQLQTKNGPCLNDQEKGDMEQVFRVYGIPPTDKKSLYMRDKTEHRRKQKHKSDMKRNDIAMSKGYRNGTAMRNHKKQLRQQHLDDRPGH